MKLNISKSKLFDTVSNIYIPVSHSIVAKATNTKSTTILSFEKVLENNPANSPTMANINKFGPMLVPITESKKNPNAVPKNIPKNSPP